MLVMCGFLIEALSSLKSPGVYRVVYLAIKMLLRPLLGSEQKGRNEIKHNSSRKTLLNIFRNILLGTPAQKSTPLLPTNNSAVKKINE